MTGHEEKKIKEGMIGKGFSDSAESYGRLTHIRGGGSGSGISPSIYQIGASYYPKFVEMTPDAIKKELENLVPWGGGAGGGYKIIPQKMRDDKVQHIYNISGDLIIMPGATLDEETVK